MLMTEWNWDGAEDEREKIARNALTKGLSPELICTITGLDMETVKSIEVR
jgi:hypothetical protein